MHSYTYRKESMTEGRYCFSSNPIHFHFDERLEGDLIIAPEGQAEIRIPAEAILKLVAFEYVLPKKISKLENMNFKDLLEGNVECYDEWENI